MSVDRGRRLRWVFWTLLGGAVVVLAGVALAPKGLAQVTATNVQDGDNTGHTHQHGDSTSGSAVAGQIVGVVSSGRASVDASNHVENSSATSGDANGSNSASSFAGNDVEGLPSCAFRTGDVHPAQAPGCSGAQSQDILFDGSTVSAPIVHDGDNRQTISQSATATSGDAVAGQVIGVVSAGDASVVAANDARNVDATSGDAHAHNSLPDVETSNLVTFVPCPCPLPQDIAAGRINAIVVHSGNDSQTIDQSANASTGDALAGAQVIGVVTSAGGRASVDARNAAQDSFATSGDAHADNTVGLAAAGDAGVDVPVCCSAPSSQDIFAGTINAAIVHDGNDSQRIGQLASASTGDALSGAQVVGVVSSGSSSVVAANTANNTDATSGDAHASNSIDDAQASDLVIFAPPACCPVPQDTVAGQDSIVAPTITAVVVQDGDNRQTLTQNASASTGDALSGAQVIGDVTSAGASSIDASNTASDTSATSGDAVSTNSIPSAFVGPSVENFQTPSAFLPFLATSQDLNNVTGVIVQDGNNVNRQNQAASAVSGDALSGAQVIGVVSSGATSVVDANNGTNIDTTSGDATFDNSVNVQTGPNVEFLGQPTPGDTLTS